MILIGCLRDVWATTYSKLILYFRDNNYTIMNGLQIDMKPAIGPLAVKVVIIAENDNAQGVVSFAAGTSNFEGTGI